MSDKTANKRVYWHSRRGMLEVDLALMPFAKTIYPTLDETEQRTYRQLLEEEDTTLFDWILQKETPEDSRMAELVQKIIDYARSDQS